MAARCTELTETAKLTRPLGGVPDNLCERVQQLVALLPGARQQLESMPDIQLIDLAVNSDAVAARLVELGGRLVASYTGQLVDQVLLERLRLLETRSLRLSLRRSRG